MSPTLAELATACVHCGLCLPACPTYTASGDETLSPRGRVLLLRAVEEGRLNPAAVESALDACLLCRACEPACPSGVEYAGLVGGHRRGRRPPLWERALLRTVSTPPLLRLLFIKLRLLRRTGLLSLLAPILPKRLRRAVDILPRRPSRFHAPRIPADPGVAKPRARVGLHLGCITRELRGELLHDTVALLRAFHYEVVVPDQPTCCGALHEHAGDPESAAAMARATLDAFAGCSAIVVPAAGCSAHLLQRSGLPILDPFALFDRDGIVPPQGTSARKVRVAYDPPCHLEHLQPEAASAIARWMARIPGVELVPFEQPSSCCGAGGAAFLRDPTTADAVTDLKVASLQGTAAEAVVTPNTGCLLRLESGLRRAGSDLPTLHPVTLAARQLLPPAE